jgi:hypothetical protein
MVIHLELATALFSFGTLFFKIKIMKKLNLTIIALAAIINFAVVL